MSRRGLTLLMLIVFLPILAVLGLYVAGPRLLKGELQSPPITEKQMSEAESKLQLEPSATPAKPSTMKLTPTDVNALVKMALQKETALKDAKVTLKTDTMLVEGIAALPRDPQLFPALLRGLAGKDVGIMLQLKPHVVGEDLYVKIENATVGVLPVPVMSLLKFLPPEVISKVHYTEHGVNINELVSTDIIISRIKIAPEDLSIDYNFKP